MQCESCTALMSIVYIGMLARLGNKQANMSLSHPGAMMNGTASKRCRFPTRSCRTKSINFIKPLLFTRVKPNGGARISIHAQTSKSTYAKRSHLNRVRRRAVPSPEQAGLSAYKQARGINAMQCNVTFHKIVSA